MVNIMNFWEIAWCGQVMARHYIYASSITTYIEARFQAIKTLSTLADCFSKIASLA